MSDRQRITLTLPEDLVEATRALSGGNLSRFITAVLRGHLEHIRRQQMRDALAAGYQAEGDRDCEISEEFRYCDYQVAERLLPIEAEP